MGPCCADMAGITYPVTDRLGLFLDTLDMLVQPLWAESSGQVYDNTGRFTAEGLAGQGIRPEGKLT